MEHAVKVKGIASEFSTFPFENFTDFKGRKEVFNRQKHQEEKGKGIDRQKKKYK